MARIDWIETRLLNWARWRLTKGTGALGFAGVNFMKAMAGHGTRMAEAPIPTNAIEAGETDDAVNKLPPDLKVTLVAHYLEEFDLGHKRRRVATMADRLRLLCCAKSTYHDRIDRAHRVLAEHFNARRDRSDAERARVGGLLAQARP